MQTNSTRLLALDVFRGLTIALMIIVNSPGNKSAYSWLEHSLWNGCSLADLVFPFFIVIMGISSVLALTNLKKVGVSSNDLYKKIIKRSLYIFALGLILNILPKHFDFTTLRILGVLQRIAICYFFSAFLFLSLSLRAQVLAITLILVSYSLLIYAFTSNLVGNIDQILLGQAHLYKPNFDPEGLLSTLPSIASALLGNILGYVLTTNRTKVQQLTWILKAGILLTFMGFLWSFSFPLNKSLWSSSYVLWTAGLAYISFAALFLLIDIHSYKTCFKPFVIFGKNSMLVYILHVFFLKIQAIILLPNHEGKLLSLRPYLTNLLFGQFSEKISSLLYALSYCFFWLLVLVCIESWKYKKKTKKVALLDS